MLTPNSAGEGGNFGDWKILLEADLKTDGAAPISVEGCFLGGELVGVVLCCGAPKSEVLDVGGGGVLGGAAETDGDSGGAGAESSLG